MAPPVAFAAAALLIAATDPGLTDADRRALASLAGTAEAGPFLVHFDPALVPPARAAAEGARAEAVLRRLEERLAVRLDGRARLFLYRDAAHFRALTGAPPSWEAFATGPRSVHRPLGSSLEHELTHLLARRFPGAADRDPGGFLREGLAVAMEGEERGVPLHSWTAVLARLGLLPPTAPLREAWPEDPPGGVPPYVVAGSFVLALLEERGAEAVKALYAAPERAGEILGEDWPDLEARWRAGLLGRTVPGAEEDAVRRWLRLPLDRLPEGLRDGAARTLFDGASLGGWEPGGGEAWTVREGRIRAEAGSAWVSLTTLGPHPPGTALRVRVRVEGAASLFLRVNRREGDSDEAVLSPSGCALTVGGGAEGFLTGPVRPVPGRWTEIVLEPRGRDAHLWIDGRLALAAPGAFRDPGGRIALGARGGVVEFAEVAILGEGRR